MAGNWHRIGDIKGADGVGVPTGGARGDVLKKEGGTDYATSWGAVNYADIQGKVPASALPEIGTAPYVVDSESAMLNLPAVPGRQAIRTDIGATFVLAEEPASTLGNWVEMVSRSDVTSVNSKTGSVVLTKADVGLSEVNNTADSDKPVVTQSVRGLMSPEDKAKLDKATHVATNGTLVERSSSGYVNVRQVALSDQPSSSGHAVPLGFLETELERVRFAGQLDGIDLDEVLDPGLYGLNAQANATTALNYPAEGIGGTLLVMRWAGASGGNRAVTQLYQGRGARSRNRVWIRSKVTATSAFTEWVELANTDLATSSSDGLMPRADKALLDNATHIAATSGSRLVRRDSSGRYRAQDPADQWDVTNKRYVDAADEALDTKIDAEITRVSGGLTVGAEDFVGIPTKSRVVVVEGTPFGSPHVEASNFNGITREQVWKVEETALGMSYATQRWTLVSCIATEQHMIGFAWERTWIPGESRWSGYTCVAGDTGVLVSRAFKAGSANFEPGKPWRTRQSTTSSTPANTTDVLYNTNAFPRVRRIGPTVNVQARFKPGLNTSATALEGNSGFFVMSWLTSICMKFWVDETASAEAASQTVNAATNNNRWRSHIVNARSSNGRFEIRASRYGPSTPRVGTWLPMNMSWAAPVPVALTRENAVDPDALPDIDEGGDEAPIPGEDDTAPDPED